jgi:hypothetical protein
MYSIKNYIKRKPRLLKGFEKSIARTKFLIISHYGEEQANAIMDESRQEYENLIPQIPYIGDKNPGLIFLLPTTRLLAIYRVLQKKGHTVESAGQLINEMTKVELKALPGFIRRIIGYLWFSSWFLNRLKKRAKKSQEREYPGDFVFNYIEGDGQKFDYGIDYIECANCKFLSAQGALELAPYICATDKITSEMLGWGLNRTRTLADGNEKCDFRFKKGGKTFVQGPLSSN